jgi:putative nucleotidyltransferase with HDIG domain
MVGLGGSLAMNTFAEDLSTSSTAVRSSREAHYQRVAVLAREIARSFTARAELKEGLREIEALAWLHECPRDIFSDLAEANPVVRGLLRAQGNEPGALMSEIVTLANSLDEMIEWLPVEHQTVTQMLDELKEMNGLGLWRPEVEAALRRIVKANWETVLSAGARLPVASIGAVRNLGVTSEAEVSAELLYQTAGHDPVLTGDLLRVVNSWACPSLRRRISSLREAIFHLGTASARTVLLAAAARKVYASKSILGLWKHSVEVAAHAQRMGELADFDPEVAFLGGLVHDVGRLAIEMLDADTLALRSRLSEPGIPVVWVDLLTCRHDHAEIGGALLWRWNFPRMVVDAVTLHHSPERSASKLAAILYLAEVRSGGLEDEPSQVKFNSALKTAGLTREQFRTSQPKDLFSSILAA